MAIDPYTHGLFKGQAAYMTGRAQRAWNRVGQEKDRANDATVRANAYLAHYVALEAQRDYLMNLLDEAHGGPENNPARQLAYNDPDEGRIPSGPREGEQATEADHIFYVALAERLKGKSQSLKEEFGSWYNLIREFCIYE
ncbi:hypothetical protein KO491_10800 [Roseovarius nubinhibens]|uniref:hypothetical protein n=1 Tax=Roseovarius nubinhibens TaxID=314263 RepID=UPI001C0A56A6|nr:hypothetical protein [Roseovarius nubinhibens]MBU3000324.1 hypothetical protein [Roseovarius nubinhibens]